MLASGGAEARRGLLGSARIKDGLRNCPAFSRRESRCDVRKMVVIAAVICAGCLVIPFRGEGISLGVTQQSQQSTPQEAIDAARRNSKPGSSFTVLREIVANADSRRVGDRALKEAQAHHIELFQNGILVDFLRSGGFLIAEYDPKTANVVALHLVSMRSDGVPNDTFYPSDSVVKLADAEELVKDTTEFVEQLYSTPAPEALSLESRFYGGRFPDCGPPPIEECTLFAVPRSLLKLGADPNEVREVAALSGDLAMWQLRYAVSMPAFAASPLVAIQASESPMEEFLRNNHLDPDFDFDPENIRSKEQLRERIDLLRRMDKYLEEALGKEANPAFVKANISIATIPLGIVADTENGQVIYSSGGASLLVIYWQRLPTGGFAVKLIGEAG